jgi:nucleoid DNA-binding protein
MAKTDTANPAEGNEPKRVKKRPGAKAGAAGKAGRAGKAAMTRKAEPAPISGPVEGGTMRAKTLVDRVVARSGTGRAAAKPVIDALLVELGDSLRRGETLVLPGMGKLKVKPAKEGAKASGVQIKLTEIKAGGKGEKKDADTPLAPTEE